jgi:cell division protein FtsB
MNHWIIIYRAAWGIVIVLVTVFLISTFIPKIQRYHESYNKRAEHQEENQRLTEDLKKLRDKQERFTSEPSYVERTAREIGMVKPDEIVFKYTNGETRTSRPIQ